MNKELRKAFMGREIVGFEKVANGVTLNLDNKEAYTLRIKEQYSDVNNLWMEHIEEDAFDNILNKEIAYINFEKFNNSEEGAYYWDLQIDVVDENEEDGLEFRDGVLFTLDYYGRAVVGISDYFELVKVK